ncbi:hypothetical protein M422DRAFT_773564 [Sphaerobolus stellatus SS14]|nr:hypothetical protein M422DRAFT_773564 [Sphaerobolus stellatus SS14]
MSQNSPNRSSSQANENNDEMPVDEDSYNRRHLYPQAGQSPYEPLSPDHHTRLGESSQRFSQSPSPSSNRLGLQQSDDGPLIPSPVPGHGETYGGSPHNPRSNPANRPSGTLELPDIGEEDPYYFCELQGCAEDGCMVLKTERKTHERQFHGLHHERRPAHHSQRADRRRDRRDHPYASRYSQPTRQDRRPGPSDPQTDQADLYYHDDRQD